LFDIQFFSTNYFCFFIRIFFMLSAAQRLAFRVTGAGAGVANAGEQKKLVARKMLENAARREVAVPSGQCTLCWLALRSGITFPIMV
jgi:hypothetical protein